VIRSTLDTKRESLSAFIDGEASEIELHRLVREFRSDESLTSSWATYQHVGSTLRTDSGAVSIEDHQQLFARITDAIGSEDSHSKEVKKRVPPKTVVAGSLALAASMVVAIYIGIQQPSESSSFADAQRGSMGTVSSNQSRTLDVQPVANQSDVQPRTSELVELDEEKQRRLRAYLNQHDQMSRMNPSKQFVNYKETPKK
jgi:sigma-E factor negative regulatory protein RseA|tara:strand:+ start:3177 stop:3776 length:600 start_codon:yes stop_codon:yes gene_type:complete